MAPMGQASAQEPQSRHPEELYDCDTKRALDELKTQTGEP